MQNVPLCRCNFVRSLSCYRGFRENVLSSPRCSFAALQLRHSSRAQISSLPSLIDRCPTIPLALRRRSEEAGRRPPGAAGSDLARLINSIHCSQAACDRCSGPSDLNPAPFYWSSCLSPHVCFLQGHYRARLRSPRAQIKCLWLIS